MVKNPGPGDRIEARCTRCNDITGHVVVALVGGQIVKVECKACGSVHKYYPPVSAKASKEKNVMYRVKPGEDRKTAATTKTVSSTTHTVHKAKKAGEDPEQVWQRALNQTLVPPRPYAMDASFAVSDVVEHSKFGLGVVQELLPPDKVQILFRDGLRLLRCKA